MEYSHIYPGCLYLLVFACRFLKLLDFFQDLSRNQGMNAVELLTRCTIFGNIGNHKGSMPFVRKHVTTQWNSKFN